MNWAKVSFKLKERGRRLSRAPNNPDANKAAVDILFGIAEALDAGLKEVNYFWIPCTDYTPSIEAWCVYAYPDRGIQNGKEKILNSRRRYKRILRAAGLDYSEMDVWQIEIR